MKELEYIRKVLESGKTSGNGEYSNRCNKWFERNLDCKKALITNSCTSAIELSALLLDLKEEDEVIIPSFSFPSIASIFLIHKCKLRFVDIDRHTLCLDEYEVEKAITDKTKVIVLVHYAGVSCDIDKIKEIIGEREIYIIEDAAQGLLAKYNNKYLGTLGDFGAISFHETKNISCGEGGVLLINNEKFIDRADIVYEKGTNRKKFLNGEVDKYSWVDVGLSFCTSEVTAAFLYSSLQNAKNITEERIKKWNKLYSLYKKKYEVPIIPYYSTHNAHIFYIIVPQEERDGLIKEFNSDGISATFHFIPLHSTEFGRTFCNYDLPVTDRISSGIIRIPI